MWDLQMLKLRVAQWECGILGQEVFVGSLLIYSD